MNPYESPATPATAESDEPKRRIRWWIPLLSLAVMLPWPLLGIGLGLVGGFFDHFWEIMFLFGGITSLLLVPFICAGLLLSEAAIGTAIGVVWCLALLAPVLIPSRLRATRQALMINFALQSGFSAAQAALGVFMIVGKSV